MTAYHEVAINMKSCNFKPLLYVQKITQTSSNVRLEVSHKSKLLSCTVLFRHKFTLASVVLSSILRRTHTRNASWVNLLDSALLVMVIFFKMLLNLFEFHSWKVIFESCSWYNSYLLDYQSSNTSVCKRNLIAWTIVCNKL